MNQQLFFLFVLVIIIAAYFGMSIVLRIIRSLPMTNVGYQQPVTTVTRTESNDGGITSTLILLIVVGGVFWLLFTNKINTVDAATKTPPTEQENEYDEELDEKLNYPEKDTKPEQEVKQVTEPYLKLPPGIDPRHINKGPEPAEEELIIGAYGIQVSAFKEYEKAAATAEELSEAYEVEVFTDNSYFKVLLTGFKSHEDAADYIEQHQLKGFVKPLDKSELTLVTKNF